jgi:hypothetical protein
MNDRIWILMLDAGCWMQNRGDDGLGSMWRFVRHFASQGCRMTAGFEKRDF